MSFKEKSAWIFAASLLVAYLAYVVVILAHARSTPIVEVAYGVPLVCSLLGVVALTFVGSVAMALPEPKQVDRNDERDTIISRYGDAVGHWVLSVAVLIPLGLAMGDSHRFWIANAIYLANVLSALSGTAVKLLAYRRGFQPW